LITVMASKDHALCVVHTLIRVANTVATYRSALFQNTSHTVFQWHLQIHMKLHFNDPNASEPVIKIYKAIGSRHGIKATDPTHFAPHHFQEIQCWHALVFCFSSHFRIDRTLHTVTPADIFCGAGNVPAFTIRHRVAREKGSNAVLPPELASIKS